MKDTIIYGTIMVVTIINILVSAYMAYASFDMMRKKCLCATSGIYWYSIFAYILFGLAFVVYSFLTSIGYVQPNYYQAFMVVYLISTVVFVFASIAYMKSIDISKCNCMPDRYRSFLSFMILLRYLGIVVVTIGVLVYGFYLFVINK